MSDKRHRHLSPELMNFVPAGILLISNYCGDSALQMVSAAATPAQSNHCAKQARLQLGLLERLAPLMM